MNSAPAIYAALQVIAAILIFVACYLFIVLCSITLLIAADLISEHARLVREYGTKSVPSLTRFLSGIDSEPRRSSRQPVTAGLSDISKNTSRVLPLALASNRRR